MRANAVHVYARDLALATTVRVDHLTGVLTCPSATIYGTNHAVDDNADAAVYTALLAGNVTITNPETLFITYS